MSVLAWRCDRCHKVTEYVWPLTTTQTASGEVGVPITYDMCEDCATALTGVLRAFVAGQIGELAHIPDDVSELEP